jgi:argininosuccinate synthase
VKLEVEAGLTISGYLEVFKALNKTAGDNGVGREDIVESRLVSVTNKGLLLGRRKSRIRREP